MIQIDRNGDGIATEKELALAKEALYIQKAISQKRMAWVAIISIMIITLFLFTPVISDARVEALSDLIGLFYISMATIPGAFMGMTAWMSRKQ